MKAIATLGLSLCIMGCEARAQEPTIRSILSKDIVGAEGKEIVVISVEYAPGGADPVHRHRAQAVVYVLEGAVVMQVQGQAPVTLSAGETFYEGPDDVHLVARNASLSRPAKFLVFFVKDKGAPFKRPEN